MELLGRLLILIFRSKINVFISGRNNRDSQDNIVANRLIKVLFNSVEKINAFVYKCYRRSEVG